MLLFNLLFLMQAMKLKLVIRDRYCLYISNFYRFLSHVLTKSNHVIELLLLFLYIIVFQMIYKLNTSIIKKSVDILYNNELENITIHFSYGFFV